ncbi:GNAT family N-acetyltransferase [Cytobacillus firmus]|uniref:GNAT family N-acetyltransferase n=1 Tax=Cytobacillus firmus TaxID=1399 RepID=UPI0018CED399|nr:GNAT family N-acetyltransferase [Cytobacillus firmus]MBG9548678.1 GCN5 family acetyltransferase [Cytobacillus firmus]MBG9603189.1 GCN5 family acetyltransferase [Cytobacillus firmus]MDD9310285.1 GNAT family N-acetyltransferase [Cytobacillus firmus]MED1939026.1 GNAT family N-acetyltransferase [Cytobacillus firmus]
MRFEPIDVAKHRNFIIPFRRDSFIVSFGSDKDFGNIEEYLDWIKTKSKQFPDGFVLAIDNEIPIGQLELTIKEYNGSKIGYVNLYYLIPEKRGMGLGKELQQYALNFFDNYGVKEYHLRVSPSNKNAINFYRKNGMQEIGLELEGKVIRMKGTL